MKKKTLTQPLFQLIQYYLLKYLKSLILKTLENHKEKLK